MTLASHRQTQPDAPKEKREYFYPESDGKPMGETEEHVSLILDTVATLRGHFVDQPDVYVMGNNFIFWEEFNRKKCVSPDTYVVFGVPPRIRSSYRAWLEGGKLPGIVMEYTSPKTRKEDFGRKNALYQDVLKVPEYILFDPLAQYLKPQLQGYRLHEGLYLPIRLEEGLLYSEQLNLYLEAAGHVLKFYDPEKRAYLLSPAEQLQRANREERNAREQTLIAREETRRAEGSARLAEEATRRANEATERADSAARYAEEESRQAEAAAERADVTARENAALKAEIEALRQRLQP